MTAWQARQREPFRVRPVELVMLEQRWCALWNAVEIGELPLGEWRELADGLSVVDPHGRTWRIATDSDPQQVRFVVADGSGARTVSDAEWPWPQRRASASVAPPPSSAQPHFAAQVSPDIAQMPPLPEPRTYPSFVPPARLASLPEPSAPRRGVLSTAVAAALALTGVLRRTPSTPVGLLRSAAALVAATAVVVVAFSVGGNPLPSAVSTGGFATPLEPGALADTPVLFPSAAGSLSVSAPRWENVTCFDAAGWSPLSPSMVGNVVTCGDAHALVTAMLPFGRPAPADPLGLCRALTGELPDAASRRAVAGQWVDVDGGQLVCTVAAVDASGNLVPEAFVLSQPG